MQFKVDNLKLESILDYEEFSVWYDHTEHKYIYVDEDGNIKELEMIARLTYDINAKMQWFADFEQIFLDTFCSGEQVEDDNISYWWFKEV